MGAAVLTEPDTAKGSRRITVIIVEDFNPLRELYKLFLTDDPAIECVGCAGTGRDAVDLASAKKPDVALVDISLPDANGLAVAREIKAVCPATHVVVLGENNGRDYHVAAKASGAGAYLRKEYTVDLLVSVIHGLVTRSGR